MSKQNMPKLPAEAIKFAKSMGLDLNGLEPEAEDIWKMLDDMSTKDPLQYEAFVSQQFENAKEGAEKSNKADDDKRSFRPVAGYCVETTSLSGDGLKIRDVDTSTGKKFFVNLCSSVVIEEPTDKTGKPIKGDRTVADGLNIPLIVGPVRPAEASSAEKDKELYVDVVLHPRVIELANKEKYFKAQIVDLALDWVIQETKVDCDRKWSHVTNATYKGGRGEKRDTPVLFFVDATGAPVSASPYADSAASSSAATGSTATPSPVLSSTSSLLSQIHKEKSGQAEEATAKVDIFAATASKASQKSTKTTTTQDKDIAQKPKVTLIQEIGAPSPKSPFAEDPVTAPKTSPATAATAASGVDEKKKTSFSAGFLNKASGTASASSSSNPSVKKDAPNQSKTASSNALLDPPGAGTRADPFLIRPSTTASATASPSTTSTATTNTTSGSGSSNKASATASTPIPPPSTTISPSTASPVSIAPAAAPATTHDVPSGVPTAKQPTKMEYHQMEQLLSNFDEEFSSANGIMNGDSTFLDTESANSMISDLAKVLGGNSSLLSATNPSTSLPSTTTSAKNVATKQATVSAPSSVSSAPGKKGRLEDHLVISNDAPGVVSITAKTEQEEGTLHAVLVLTITGLSSSLDTSTMELLVSSNEVIVKVDRQYLADQSSSSSTTTSSKMASFGAKFDTSKGVLKENTAAAGFKKKKGVLTVKIQYS